jgi:hypothetical protein
MSWRRRRVRRRKMPRVVRRLALNGGDNPVARMVLRAQQRFATETVLIAASASESTSERTAAR